MITGFHLRLQAGGWKALHVTAVTSDEILNTISEVKYNFNIASNSQYFSPNSCNS